MKKTDIGGQAVIEGVMMRGHNSIATAVRCGNDIVVKKDMVKPLTRRYKILSLPFIRGTVALIDSLIIGIRTLSYSAELVEGESQEEEPSKFELFLKKVFGDKLDDAIMYLSVALSLAISIIVFFIGPTYVAGFLKRYTENTFLINLFEGVLRVAIFIAYLALISRMEDIKRVFEYHGAEHKTIHCFEHEEELTVENARKYTTLHPRCGTNFLFIVMIVSIIVFSFLRWPSLYVRIISRILLLPVVAGISYEVIKIAGHSDNKVIAALVYPGLILQKLTTKEPDDSQLEVAIASLKSVLEDEGGKAFEDI
ncbi:DUF1385 domain-containing protein [Thermoanaerobacterium sp. R66]|uniref:DUF1385 domain-containing protein n=1 Tax=Thermoanaerobacterium sp. R66 TaxID=2742479 RepID=UPI00176B389E|nr:DUF1385 domain-containing protein [Thermoanaerobacterium sp. R66]MDE4542817.1 DUF1385 domain-containing protein [Thermoanaerobacterium sp. R66]HHV74800.1 DUF1385 domain-containing protein [Thermoanaerobacterium sp.]